MKRLFFLFIGIIMTNLAFSQTASPELISSAGDSFNNTSYQLDWSIGECITATHSAGSYVITQGLHQSSYDIATEIDLAQDINITVYPNPTSDLISLSGFQTLSGLHVRITDINGKVLQQAEVTNETEQLNFSNYAAGTYFISVTENNQLIKSFKIIKN